MSTNTIETWQDVENRPHPKKMAIQPLIAEWDTIREGLHDDPEVLEDGNLTDSLSARSRTIRNELERRLDVNYPECPQCGATGAWGIEFQGWLQCFACSFAPNEGSPIHDWVRRNLLHLVHPWMWTTADGYTVEGELGENQ